MKKIFKPIIALLSGAAILLSGCSDFLNPEDKSNLYSDAYFQSADGFDNLSTTPYYNLLAIYSGDLASFCSGTAHFLIGRCGYSYIPIPTYNALHPYNPN